MNLFEELEWRGMLQDSIPGTKEYIESGKAKGYIGFDPTAPSLHIGNLATIMLLVHLQKHNGKPFILMGGATGRIGDPSFKNTERVLLDDETVETNLKSQRSQFEKFLAFDGENAAEIVNNYDWYKDMNVLTFLRDVGKNLTINYMMAKDSVKSRLETGLSFTEFSYQLLQGYDFYHLFKEKDIRLEMGGSDQWGNITAGTEMIRRLAGEKAYALTCPLVTKADGTKFGKSEGGNIWLDAELTSPYKFYQYFLNASDEDAVNFLKVFSLKPVNELKQIIAQHEEMKGARIAQKALAEELTARVHSQEELNAAMKASSILFGKSSKEDFESFTEKQFLELFEAVPQSEISSEKLQEGVPIFDFASSITGFLASSSEARRAIKEGSLKVNRAQVSNDTIINEEDLMLGKYILLQRGKKKYFLVKTGQ